MTDDRSLERAARTWLEEGPTRAPDRPVEAALARIQTTTQERDLRIPWRPTTMFERLAVAAAAVVLATGGIALGAILVAPPPVGPIATGTAAPPPTVSPSPDTSPMSSSTAPTQRPAPPDADHLVTVQGMVEPGHFPVVIVMNADGSGARPLFMDAVEQRVRTTLLGRTADGSQVLVRLQSSGPDVALDLALGDVASGQLHRITRTCPTRACWADFDWTLASLSPDGRSAALTLFGAVNPRVGIVDLETGATTILAHTATPDYIGMSVLSPDGARVAYVQSTPIAERFPRCEHADAGALMVARLSGGEPAMLVSGERCATNPVWSSDSSQVLFSTAIEADATGTELSDVYLVAVAGGPPEQLTADGRSTFAAWTIDGDVSYSVLPRTGTGAPQVWILDLATAERTAIAGDLDALRAAGCLACHISLAEPTVDGTVYVGGLGLWSRD